MTLRQETENQSYPVYRWVILLLIFLATTNNYLNRIVLSVASVTICKDLDLDKVKYGYVLTAFGLMYALGHLVAGKIIDKMGTKLGYLLYMVLWSLSGALTGFSNGLYSLCSWRSLLGATESGNFPGAIKAVAEWFAPAQRALATALFNSGPHIALVAGSPLIAELTGRMGWRWTFCVIGLSGILLAVIWQIFYRRPDHLYGFSEIKTAAADSALNLRSIQRSIKETDITQQEDDRPVKWRDIILQRETWGLIIAKFCTDPVWWFYIFWLPTYLNDTYNFNIKDSALTMSVIYALAIILSNLAGWFTGLLMQRGWSSSKARKVILIICAACMPITALSGFTPYPWVVVVLVSLAAGAHSGWSANLYSLVSDNFSSKAVASVTGLTQFAGGMGGIVLSALTPGFIIKYYGHKPVFVLMALLHPFAFLCIHLLKKKKKA